MAYCRLAGILFTLALLGGAVLFFLVKKLEFGCKAIFIIQYLFRFIHALCFCLPCMNGMDSMRRLVCHVDDESGRARTEAKLVTP